MATYRTFKETSTQDLSFENGDFPFVEDREAVNQQVETNLRLSKDNWFLNLDEGINYAGEGGVLGRKEITSATEAVFVNEITGTYGVRELSSIELELEDNTLTVDAVYIDVFSEEQTIEITV
jgi:hypothetical protein